MTYASGETPMVGDRVSNKMGRIGIVMAVPDHGILTVKWHGGAVGINYTVAERFTLISRAPEQEGIAGTEA
jgi:hypothetical protein